MVTEITFDLPVEFTSVSRAVSRDHYSRISGDLALGALNRHYGYENGEIPFDTLPRPDDAEHVAATANLLRGGVLCVTLKINRDGSFDFVRASVRS